MEIDRHFYRELLEAVQTKINHAQQRAVSSVNRELILLYWEVGKLIHLKQQQEGWGSAVIPRLSNDINNLLPELKGFSARNIGRMVAFYRDYSDLELVLPQTVAKSESPSILPQAAAKLETLIFSLP